jgi:hypothetical protein
MKYLVEEGPMPLNSVNECVHIKRMNSKQLTKQLYSNNNEMKSFNHLIIHMHIITIMSIGTTHQQQQLV